MLMNMINTGCCYCTLSFSKTMSSTSFCSNYFFVCVWPMKNLDITATVLRMAQSQTYVKKTINKGNQIKSRPAGKATRVLRESTPNKPLRSRLHKDITLKRTDNDCDGYCYHGNALTFCWPMLSCVTENFITCLLKRLLQTQLVSKCMLCHFKHIQSLVNSTFTILSQPIVGYPVSGTQHWKLQNQNN